MGLTLVVFGQSGFDQLVRSSPPKSTQVRPPVRRPVLVIDLKNVKIKEENTFSDLEGTNQEK